MEPTLRWPLGARLSWWLLLITLVQVFIVAGLVTYLAPQWQRLEWLSYVLALLTGLCALAAVDAGAVTLAWRRNRAVVMAGLAFVAIAVLSSLLNRSSPVQFVLASKSLFPMAGLWMALVLLPANEKALRQLLAVLLGVVIIQVPVLLWQFFFIRPAQLEASYSPELAWDSVSGTFGGSMDAGGLSAVLAVYLVCALAMLAALRRAHVLQRGPFAFWVLVCVLPLFLIEVKALFVYLPLCYLLLFLDQLPRKPARFFAGLVGVLLLVAALGTMYFTTNWRQGLAARTAVAEAQVHSDTAETRLRAKICQKELLDANLITRTLSYPFRIMSLCSRTGSPFKLTRWEALATWAWAHESGPWHAVAVGHGFGEARTQGLRPGKRAREFSPLYIDRMGVTLFLWETGVAGLLAIAAMFVFSTRKAWRRAGQPPEPHGGIARALFVILPVLGLSMLYRNDIPYSANMMALWMLALGLLDWTERRA